MLAPGESQGILSAMTTKAHDTHEHASASEHAKKETKPANGGEKIIDSLGQENPAQELEKKNLKEAQDKAAKAEKEEEKKS